MQLGHNGAACPSPVIFETPLIVYHTNSAHFVKVSYCQCSGPAGGYLYPNQLLRSTWFLASLTHLRTAFTFAVLKHFHHLTLQGKTMAYDFYNSLVHETDNTSINPPPVSSSWLYHDQSPKLIAQKQYDEFLVVASYQNAKTCQLRTWSWWHCGYKTWFFSHRMPCLPSRWP